MLPNRGFRIEKITIRTRTATIKPIGPFMLFNSPAFMIWISIWFETGNFR